MINYKNLDKPALITKDKVYSFGQAMSMIGAYAKAFQNIPQNKNAIYSENRV
jgi:hypothetical protein